MALNLPQESGWCGGSTYYAQFPKANAAGWDDPSFFPISVFFGRPAHSEQLAALGINTFMGAEHNGPLQDITDAGIFLIAQGEWTPAELGDSSYVVGWHASDECDMGLGGCGGGDEYDALAIQAGYVADIRALQDGRFAQANYGNGVLRTFWSRNTMDDHIALTDLSSVDKYAYTSPHVQAIMQVSDDWPQNTDPAVAASYGWFQDQMERFQNPSNPKPNWVFVETAKPYLEEQGATTITPEQISGAVWSAIIHGALGIAYFQHNNNDDYGTYSLVTGPQTLKDAVTALNAKVQSLAAVINTRSYVWNFDADADTMLKEHDGWAYIFAGVGLGQQPGAKTFTLPPSVDGNIVQVVGENRSLAISNGAFTDSFPQEHSTHVYRMQVADSGEPGGGGEEPTMPSPTPSWDLVRVYGRWRGMNGALKSGTYKVTIPVRVTNATDDAIIPAGVYDSGSLGSGSGMSLDVMVPATNDPDTTAPNGWKVEIEVTFPDAAGEKYRIEVPYANRPTAAGGNGLGVNLRTMTLS